MRSRDYDMIRDCGAPCRGPAPIYKYPGRLNTLTPAITRQGVQSPVIDKLIAQIIAAQGDKTKLIPLGRALDRVLTWNYYMLPMWYMAEDRLAWWDKFSHPAIRPIYTMDWIPGGMTSTKRQNFPPPDDRENKWAPT